MRACGDGILARLVASELARSALGVVRYLRIRGVRPRTNRFRRNTFRAQAWLITIERTGCADARNPVPSAGQRAFPPGRDQSWIRGRSERARGRPFAQISSAHCLARGSRLRRARAATPGWHSPAAVISRARAHAGLPIISRRDSAPHRASPLRLHSYAPNHSFARRAFWLLEILPAVGVSSPTGAATHPVSGHCQFCGRPWRTKWKPGESQLRARRARRGGSDAWAKGATPDPLALLTERHFLSAESVQAHGRCLRGRRR